MKRFLAGSVRWLVLSMILSSLGFSQITPSADSYTNTATSTTNYGAKTLLDVDGATQITYIQFNLASIPTTATVSQATLKLYANSVTTAGSFNVDYVNSAWSESTIDASNAPTPGTTIASNVNVATTDKNQYILVDVTSAVQAWLSGAETNNGIALVANGTFNATFDSKENTTTSPPPELDIAYAGGDGTITGVTTAPGSGLTGGGTSGTLNLGLTNACAANQVLQWSGSAWACSSAGTGTITAVNAGTGISVTSGPSPTVSVNTAQVPLLAASNSFTGNQTVTGNINATGIVSASAFYDSLGTQVLSILPGSFNLYVGQSAGQGAGANNTGSNNTSAGYQTLFLNTSGSFNAALGMMALYNNTTGTQNTASGEQALFNNTSGTQNTATGAQALINNSSGGGNTGLGVNALYSSNTGGNNTALGDGALYNNSSGSGNTASGFLSGGSADGSAITGLNNSFVGTSSSLSTGNLNNATAIGAYAEVAESNALVLGSINGVNGCLASNSPPCASVNVGIGTTTPAYTLQVDAAPPNNNGLDTVAVTSGGSNYVSSLLLKNTSGSGLYLREGAGTGTTYLASSGSMEFVTKDTGNPNNPSGATVSIDTSGDVTIPGNLRVNGSVSKGGGSFKIDHPLDPANKYLYHSFVESPDMMNIYNGVATLDSRGSAWITMPDYFEALNRDFRYQLTSMGRPQPSLYIATEISGNHFRIAGGKPGGRVSWQVTGIRHDAYANANRIQVEVEKPPQEQGHYLHPELFGAPPERAVGYRVSRSPTDAVDQHEQGRLTKAALRDAEAAR